MHTVRGVDSPANDVQAYSTIQAPVDCRAIADLQYSAAEYNVHQPPLSRLDRVRTLLDQVHDGVELVVVQEVQGREGLLHRVR